MKTFVEIVDCGSLTAAAEALDTSLPTVVRTLANLESYLDTRLLNRTTRKITLTEEGSGYLHQCRNILNNIEEAELELSSLHNKPSGKLTVTASVMFGRMKIAPLVNQFLSDNPKVNIDLILSDSNLNLVEDAVDVAIRIGNLSDSSMFAKKVGEITRVICATPKLLNSLDKISHPKQLTALPCIQFSGLSQGSHWQLQDKQRLISVPISGPLSCNQIDVALDAVKASMGVGLFLSYQVEDLILSGELQEVLADYKPTSIPVSVVYSHSKLMSTRVRVFVDWITQRLRLKDQ